MATTALQNPDSVGGYTARVTPTKEGLRMSHVASRMWRPMAAMGAMLIAGGLAFGIASASRADDFFSLPSSVVGNAPADGAIMAERAFHEAVNSGWLPPVLFLGVGLLLSAVTFLLATILGTLRDGGRDVQRAVGGDSVDLVKPVTAKLFPPVMMMGLMVLMAGVVVGIVLSGLQGDYWSHAGSQVVDGPATPALASDLADIQSIRAWLQPLDFVGMGLILTGIVLALATIVRALRFQAARVVQLAGGEAQRAA